MKRGWKRKRHGERREKKAQTTIFIIIAVLIIAGVLIYFLLQKKTEIVKPSGLNVESYIRKCTQDATRNAIDIMLSQGGYIEPKNYKLYNDKKVAYLCYNKNYYLPCINQEPLYIQHLEQEIKSFIEGKIDECFYQLKAELEKRHYEVDSGKMILNTGLFPREAEIKISREFVVSKGEETKRYTEFKVSLNSPLYDLAIVAQEIADQEARFCNFEYLGYMLLYPEVKIEKKAVGQGEDASKIYIIEDKASKKKLYLAVRSCAIPPGF